MSDDNKPKDNSLEAIMKRNAEAARRRKAEKLKEAQRLADRTKRTSQYDTKR